MKKHYAYMEISDWLITYFRFLRTINKHISYMEVSYWWHFRLFSKTFALKFCRKHLWLKSNEHCELYASWCYILAMRVWQCAHSQVSLNNPIPFHITGNLISLRASLDWLSCSFMLQLTRSWRTAQKMSVYS